MNRVWTYVISRPLSGEELKQLVASGQEFVSGWSAHENKLEASFEIFGERIIVVQVNEYVYGASGCSIDKLTRFIKDAEKQFHCELLNRFLVAFKQENKLEVMPAGKIKELLEQGLITENTLVYNTAVANDQELSHWEEPLKNTWLNKYLVRH